MTTQPPPKRRNVWLWVAVALYISNLAGWFIWVLAKGIGGAA